MSQHLGYVMPESVKDSYCFLICPNTGTRFYADRDSRLHGELDWPLAEGVLFRFETESPARRGAAERAINARFEGSRNEALPMLRTDTTD
jgi:hypothetical protein